MITKTRHYIIECTLDPDYKNWEVWNSEIYKSYSVIKNEVWKATQAEAEFNRSKLDRESGVQSIVGFRIVQKHIEITTNVVTEFLF